MDTFPRASAVIATVEVMADAICTLARWMVHDRGAFEAGGLLARNTVSTVGIFA
jgi:hypothetical protein